MQGVCSRRTCGGGGGGGGQASDGGARHVGTLQSSAAHLRLLL